MPITSLKSGNALMAEYYLWDFPCGSAGKESACNEGDLGSIPGLGRYPGEGKGYPLQYSGMDSRKQSDFAKSQTERL